MVLGFVAVVMTALAGNAAAAPTTPIKHLILIFDENNSFDHYFGTYPNALNPDGEPTFTAKPGTPSINGLTPALLTSNPNSSNPFRFKRSQPITCDNGHGYKPEQAAFNGGAMNKFVESTSCSGNNSMGYYDGNTVTALWNYAQNYALSDASFGSTFGPSAPGHINLVSGQTGGATTPDIPGAVENGVLFGTAQAHLDECGARAGGLSYGAAPNIGTLLSAKGVSWGYFMGGFRPTGSNAGGAVCGTTHANVGGGMVTDYVAHHQPFQYYDATRNPKHTAPAAVTDIGHDDPVGPADKVNHQYDLADFKTALDNGSLPEVTILKPRGFEDGHAGYSSPLDEQRFLVNTVNTVQASPYWPDSAIIIAYDDSDGWYDHVASPIVNSSFSATWDVLDGAGQCHGPAPSPPAAGGVHLRCGYGPRLPLLVISPYARVNHVDHTVVDHGSVLRFIEDNWATGQIGGTSYDDMPNPKPTINGMFDFSVGATRAGKLVLDPESGARPGEFPKPAPTATATATPSATPAPTATPLPVVTRRAALRLTLKAKPKRDKRKPFVFRLSGVLTPPAGLAAAKACTGQVSIGAVVGQRVVTTRRARLSSKCTWSLKLTFKNAAKLGRGRLTIRATFLGNTDVLSIKAKALKVRAG